MSESIQRRQMLQEQIGRLYLTDRLGNFLLIREMEAGVQAIERGLLPNIPELREERREVDHRAIALSLPSQGLLLEYLRYHRYDFASKSWAEERYAVFTLEQGAEGKLAIHDLGEAEPIDRLIQTFRHMARHMGSGRAKNAQRMSVAEVKAKEFREAIEEVAELVWNPLGDVVRNRRVVVVPDGEVAMVPFDLFVGAGSVTYLAASADLIERKGDRSATSHASPLVIGDPNYHFTGEAITATATTETIEATATAHPTPQETPKIGHEETQETARSLFREAASGLTRLPGTRLEVYRTARLLGVEAVVWDDAQTAILRQRRAPSSLIIAAHGLAMEDMALLHPAEGPGGVSMRSLIGHLESALDPLQRCGIALAGAGNFLKSTSRDASAQDGFLTGQKITALDLRGTDVILSCCNTNVVVRRDGRGLLGLRTALFHAGARSLILTLWPISDFATGPFMEELCRRRYTEKQGAEVALKGTKDYLRTLTIGEMKRGYWLSEEARETLCELRKGSAGHPDDEAVFDKTLAEMDDLRQRPNTDCPFADPLYWAAFVLYGDPIAQVD